MRSLIFGAGGLLGRPLARELERRGVDHLGARPRRGRHRRPRAGDGRGAIVSPRRRSTTAPPSRGSTTARSSRRWRTRSTAGRSAHLAAAARAASATLVQVSTDFVFDGAARVPYLEESRTGAAPGLRAARSSRGSGRRSSGSGRWWCAPAGCSAPARPASSRTIVRLLTRPAPVRVVDDQVGCPTYAPFLARALIALAERGARGIVHYRNEGPVSWHGFAVEIARRVAPGREIAAISTAEFPRPARRPAYSVLDVERYETIVGRAGRAVARRARRLPPRDRDRPRRSPPIRAAADEGPHHRHHRVRRLAPRRSAARRASGDAGGRHVPVAKPDGEPGGRRLPHHALRDRPARLHLGPAHARGVAARSHLPPRRAELRAGELDRSGRDAAPPTCWARPTCSRRCARCASTR